MNARKFFITAAMLLSFTGAAFSQALISTGTQARVAEEHKYGAQLGAITLTLTIGTAVTGSVTMQFFDGSGQSVPLVAAGQTLNNDVGGFCTLAGGATLSTITVVNGSNTATIQNLGHGAGAGAICTITGLRVDLRNVAAGSTVTVNFSATGNTITAGQTQALVVSRVVGVLSLGTVVPSSLVNTGGISGTATVPLVENVLDGYSSAAQEVAFGPAGAVGQSIDVKVQGVPNGGALDLSFGALPIGTTVSIVVSGVPTLWTGTNTVTLTGTGGDLSYTIRFENTNQGAFETLNHQYVFRSAAATTPLSGGNITAMYMMGPSDGGLAVPASIPSFDQSTWIFSATIITISEADCTILSNHVTVTGGGVGGGGVDTGMSIANTSAFGSVLAITGPITFWFYNTDATNGGALPVVGPYTTSAASPGIGLDANGELEPGSNYVVLASELWAAAGGSGDFTGHTFATGDFLYCHGFNFISDFATFSQSYIPEVVGTGPRFVASGTTPESAGQ